MTTKTYQEFEAIAVGVIYASVCTNLSDDEATERLNAEHPTGVTPWAISDGDFRTGEPNPHPCERKPDNRHILFDC